MEMHVKYLLIHSFNSNGAECVRACVCACVCPHRCTCPCVSTRISTSPVQTALCLLGQHESGTYKVSGGEKLIKHDFFPPPIAQRERRGSRKRGAGGGGREGWSSSIIPLTLCLAMQLALTNEMAAGMTKAWQGLEWLGSRCTRAITARRACFS